MIIEARLKKIGGDQATTWPTTQVIAEGGSILINEFDLTIPISCTGSVNTSTTGAFLCPENICPDRTVRIVNVGTGTLTLKHTAFASAAYSTSTFLSTFTGGADVPMTPGSSIVIFQHPSGYWIRVNNVNV